MTRIQKVENHNRKTFSNAKSHYYTMDVLDEDGKPITLLFTKREILFAQDKFLEFISKKT